MSYALQGISVPIAGRPRNPVSEVYASQKLELRPHITFASSTWAGHLAGARAMSHLKTGLHAVSSSQIAVSVSPWLILPVHGVALQDEMLQDLDGMISDGAIAIKVLKEYGGADLLHPSCLATKRRCHCTLGLHRLVFKIKRSRCWNDSSDAMFGGLLT